VLGGNVVDTDFGFDGGVQCLSPGNALIECCSII
jgi:hypothetical protein